MKFINFVNNEREVLESDRNEFRVRYGRRKISGEPYNEQEHLRYRNLKNFFYDAFFDGVNYISQKSYFLLKYCEVENVKLQESYVNAHCKSVIVNFMTNANYDFSKFYKLVVIYPDLINIEGMSRIMEFAFASENIYIKLNFLKAASIITERDEMKQFILSIYDHYKRLTIYYAMTEIAYAYAEFMYANNLRDDDVIWSQYAQFVNPKYRPNVYDAFYAMSINEDNFDSLAKIVAHDQIIIKYHLRRYIRNNIKNFTDARIVMLVNLASTIEMV
jgi:hypothetical protein